MEEKEVYVCWISEKDSILSFHYEEGYIKKEFITKEDFQEFILAMAKYYRVQ